MKLVLILFLSIISVFANEFASQKIKIIKISDETAIVNKGNFNIGQSGIIIHSFPNNRSTILSSATVTESNENNSTIKILVENVIPQDAIPTTNLKPSVGDIFIINHLYSASMMIVPNFEAEQVTRKAFPKYSFLSSDIFAGYLKINETPAPTKDIIQSFAKTNNLGTVLFYVDNKLYLVDTLSFKVIKTYNLPVKNKKFISPFLTNVKNIETGVLDFTSLEKIENYNKYYKELLGIKDGK